MELEYKHGYAKALDGIRGLAITLVLLFHCVKTGIFPLSVICRFGWSGVDLFFVLSGFLITGILYDSKGNKYFIRNFYIKRILRIFPLYYFSLFVFFMVLLVPGVSAGNRYLDKRLFDHLFFYLTYMQNLYVSFRGVNWLDTLNHFWSLAIEEQFYLVWPFVVLWVSKRNLAVFSFTLVCVASLVRNLSPGLPFSYAFTACRMDALALGSLAAIAIRRFPVRLGAALPYLWMLATSAFLLSVTWFHSVSIDHLWFIRYGYTLLDVCFALLVISLFDKGRTGRLLTGIFSSRLLCFLGKYAYGIYVYHWLLYRGVYMYLLARFTLPDAFILVFLAAVIGVSFISYHLFEKQFLKLKENYR